ncbi:endopeptidase La [bacterium]|mgnify:CR=1 FL=1|nr:MAG: endopeptidase La [bacterium]
MGDSDTMTEKVLERLSVLPLVDNVAFPGLIVPLVVSEEEHIALVDDVVSHGKVLALLAARPGVENATSFDNLYAVGVRASVLKMLRFPDGSIRMLAKCINRIRLEERIKTTPYLVAKFTEILEKRTAGVEETALVRTIISQFKEVASLAPYLPDDLPIEMLNIDDPGRLADSIAAALNISVERKQSLLEKSDVLERLRELQSFLSAELSVLRISNEIQNRATESIKQGQREYMLREQLKAIKKELGEEEGAEIEELRKKLAEKDLPDEARKAGEHEIERLERMNPASAEYSVALTYVDWILNLPWTEGTEDQIDIKHAQKILDEDHYDLDKVKERILEFLAVRKLKPDAKSPILLFIGPPGVGKTSLGMSIARAMGRKFYRMSLGGMRDEAEIRGHRRTYVGALPGRIIQGIKKCGSNNPVFMLDEVDKIGQDFRGDPASALLEVLDPEQNHTFADHYLEVPFDLSRVMFIGTANYIDPIPRVLLDRMETIRLPGYTIVEKIGIAKNYLIDKQREAHGLNAMQISFMDEAIDDIIDNYTREAGVRNLDRAIATICRKVTKEIASNERERAIITPNRVREYLGPEYYIEERLPDKMLPGMAIGLAWTPVGGEILIVEATVMEGNKSLVLTGHLGDVMKESAQTALSWVRSKADSLNIDKDFNKFDIHLHVPAGAIPKDGPSAGIAMATCLASLLTRRPIREKTAMTGEVTLRGEVLPIGGVKEKVLAADQAGIQRILLPIQNKKDMEDIPEEITKRVKFIFVSNMDEVLEVALECEQMPEKTSEKEVQN